MDSSCTIYDIGEMPVEGGGGQRFIAMEFLDGQTLERHISGKPCPWMRRWSWPLKLPIVWSKISNALKRLGFQSRNFLA
jgi:hypothetical protein